MRRKPGLQPGNNLFVLGIWGNEARGETSSWSSRRPLAAGAVGGLPGDSETANHPSHESCHVKPGRGNSLVRIHNCNILSSRAGSPARPGRPLRTAGPRRHSGCPVLSPILQVRLGRRAAPELDLGHKSAGSSQAACSR